jgi:8-oxo-dGTP pyrophosphatase MutT (NUDIX family)
MLRSSVHATPEGTVTSKWVAALPDLAYANATLSVCLITSRDTDEWIVPKGTIHAGEEPRATAEREGFEEAGARA